MIILNFVQLMFHVKISTKYENKLDRSIFHYSSIFHPFIPAQWIQQMIGVLQDTPITLFLHDNKLIPVIGPFLLS